MNTEHNDSGPSADLPISQRRQILIALAGLLGATAACSGGGDDSQSMPTPSASPVPAPTGGLLSATAIVAAMGSGFNLGNTFDIGAHSTEPESIYPLIDLYQSAGMRHIRIPVTWMEDVVGSRLADATGLVNAAHPRLAQLKAVVDYALAKNLYVILNTHHERWLYKTYDGSVGLDAIFTRLWQGIAAVFADRSQKLIFEVLNEPQDKFGDWSGGASPSDPRALELTRRINKVGYDAIRSSGGQNSQRMVLVGTNGMGNHTQLRLVYPTKADLPGRGTDKFLAAEVHTYDPWAFCGEDGNNAAWPGDAATLNAIAAVVAHASALGIPLNYGEFGVGRRVNQIERDTDLVRGFYRVLNSAVLKAGMAPTVWDDRGWFGLVAATGTKDFTFVSRIVPTMLAG